MTVPCVLILFPGLVHPLHHQSYTFKDDIMVFRLYLNEKVNI
jgi:hypothetical protein